MRKTTACKRLPCARQHFFLILKKRGSTLRIVVVGPSATDTAKVLSLKLVASCKSFLPPGSVFDAEQIFIRDDGRRVLITTNRYGVYVLPYTGPEIGVGIAFGAATSGFRGVTGAP